jgi:hypothetical protein
MASIGGYGMPEPTMELPRVTEDEIRKRNGLPRIAEDEIRKRNGLPRLTEDEMRLWEKAEDVALHFNEMIMNFRLKAVGALAVGGGLVGTVLLPKDGGGAAYANYMVFAGAMVFLAVVWLGIMAIDLGYYVPLLLGAVKDVIRIENRSGGEIQLSTLIEKESKRHWWLDAPARWAFYLLPLAALLAAAYLAWSNVP